MAQVFVTPAKAGGPEKYTTGFRRSAFATAIVPRLRRDKTPE
jgi:hypothetical protein